MRVIIVGCGRVGSRLANSLSAERHDVVVIDNNPLSFARLSRDFTGRMLTGVGFDRELLQKADIESADGLAATTNSDNVNIVVAVTAKETFKVPRVVARIYDAEAAEIYRREGIPTVTPTLWGANTMRAMILHPQLSTLTTFGNGEVQIVYLEVPNALVGRIVKDLHLPGELRVNVLVRRGQAMIPQPELQLERGDVLYIAATDAAMPKLEQMLAH